MFVGWFSIKNGRLHRRLYDKRQDFGLRAQRSPTKDSNIRTKPVIGTFYSEIYRIYRVADELDDFLEEVKIVYNLATTDFSTMKRRRLLSSLVGSLLYNVQVHFLKKTTKKLKDGSSSLFTL